MSERPVIGISAYAQQARWGSWDLPAVLLPRRYTDMVALGGGQPVVLPPQPGVASLLARLDGLVLSGGGDIDPVRYGAARDPATDPANQGRDDAELDLARQAIAAGLPLLGICRGLQVVNVALGGTLHQHLPALVGHDGHSPEQHGYGSHKVSVAAGSKLAGILGRTEAAVPTHHHQSVGQLGDGLIATAWTDDGIVEAAELAGPASFMIAVQWHPEAGEDLSLFTGLAAASEQYRAAR
ncbi:MAG TPA: gamma-glutamyl-gamma-aminobutyrate hydrolase family protein [Streptosporangiaceae bacterium]